MESKKIPKETNNADIEKLKAEVEKLKEKNSDLTKLLMYGNISPLDTTIEKYTDVSNRYIRQIMSDFLKTDYQSVAYHSLSELISYLKYVIKELNGLVSVQSGMYTPTMYSFLDAKDEIMSLFAQIEQIKDVTDAQYKSLLPVMEQFRSNLSQFCSQCEPQVP